MVTRQLEIGVAACDTTRKFRRVAGRLKRRGRQQSEHEVPGGVIVYPDGSFYTEKYMSTVTMSNTTDGRFSGGLDALFRDHRELILRTAYGVTGSRDDAQDVLQTVFLRLIRRELPPDLAKNPRAYFYRAAVNVSLSLLRQRKRRPLAPLSEHPDFAAVPLEPDVLEERHRLLYESLAELDTNSAEVVILRHVHGLNISEIAALLSKSRSLIAVRLFRARKRLKKMVLAALEKKQ
jgi:RNA polymerase sigma-70 factor (ECF subfamily)